jgi:serine/threonine protein kinase
MSGCGDDQMHTAEIHTEFAENGSLESVLKHRKAGSFWNPSGIQIVICGIVLGMRFVHACGFIHRDLKPSNILINARGEPLIADFGTSVPEEYKEEYSSEGGSVHYAAPEQYLDEFACTNKVDVFAFGLILYEILVGSPVFAPSMEPFPVMRQLCHGEMPSIPDKCGVLMQNLIPRCWSMDPTKRPSFDDIFNEFAAQEFELFTGTDSVSVRNFVWGVLAWEERSRLRVSDSAADAPSTWSGQGQTSSNI